MSKYEKEREVFSGPFCDVYKAKDQLGNVVALKVVDVDFLRKPHNFRREVTLLKRLQHTGIAEYVDDYNLGEDLYLVMRYYEVDLISVMRHFSKKKVKFNLEDPIKNTTVMVNEIPLEKIPKMVENLAAALSFVHSQGIIHRDIKPANIFFNSIDELESPVLGDFGIAYDTRSPPADEPANEKFTDVSTGYYKAPELCFGVGDYSTEIDLWSLGILISYLYSKNARPVNYVDEDGDDSNMQLNDFVLIQGIFSNFGTPSTTATDSPLYWARLGDASTHFANFQFKHYARKPTAQLLPRCNNDVVAQLFERLTTYASRRIVAD